MTHIHKTKNWNCLEEAQILVFLDKDFTLTTINIFKELKGSMSKEVQESVRKYLTKWRIQINTIFKETNKNSGIKKVK